MEILLILSFCGGGLVGGVHSHFHVNSTFVKVRLISVVVEFGL